MSPWNRTYFLNISHCSLVRKGSLVRPTKSLVSWNHLKFMVIYQLQLVRSSYAEIQHSGFFFFSVLFKGKFISLFFIIGKKEDSCREMSAISVKVKDNKPCLFVARMLMYIGIAQGYERMERQSGKITRFSSLLYSPIWCFVSC